MREGRRVQRPRQTYVWPIRQLRNFVAAQGATIQLTTVGSAPCRYIEPAILITLNVALILVHCMCACAAKGAPTATDICLVKKIRLGSNTIKKAPSFLR